MSSPTWNGEDTPDQTLNLGVAGWFRVTWRGAVLVLVILVCFVALLVLRLVERPLFGAARPWTPVLTLFVCRTALGLMGLGYQRHGTPMEHPGAVVANHSSWLDIFTLNRDARVYFVSKDDVARWPGIGWLARATGTVFIRRSARDAAAQRAIFEERLLHGHKLLFFPEGTSTDGLRVLAFKPTLFAAFFAPELRDLMWAQPVTVAYNAPDTADPRFYGWWGDMSFGTHLLKTLAAGAQGQVTVTWHRPLRVADFADRKSLARAAEQAVRGAHTPSQVAQ